MRVSRGQRGEQGEDAAAEADGVQRFSGKTFSPLGKKKNAKCNESWLDKETRSQIMDAGEMGGWRTFICHAHVSSLEHCMYCDFLGPKSSSSFTYESMMLPV